MRKQSISSSILVATLLSAVLGRPLLAEAQNTQQAEEQVGAAPATATAGNLVGNASDGQRLYLQTGCYACHGTIGQGAFLAGPKLKPPLLPYQAFIGQLRDPASRMPRYGPEVMTDQQVANIYAYLQAIPAPKTADEIDILREQP